MDQGVAIIDVEKDACDQHSAHGCVCRRRSQTGSTNARDSDGPERRFELNTRGEFRLRSHLNKVLQHSEAEDPLYQRATKAWSSRGKKTVPGYSRGELQIRQHFAAISATRCPDGGAPNLPGRGPHTPATPSPQTPAATGPAPDISAGPSTTPPPGVSVIVPGGCRADARPMKRPVSTISTLTPVAGSTCRTEGDHPS